MADTWVTDMHQYLTQDGELADLGVPALNLALHQGSIVAWMTSHAPQQVERTNVYCRRSPDRKRCSGEIMAAIDKSSEAITWECPLCGDNGFIHNWQGTPWDRRS